MRLHFFFASLLFASTASAGVFPAIPEECAATVRFYSSSMGVDGTIVSAVRSYAKEQDSIERTIETRWGREGELDICLVATYAEFDDAIFEHMKALLPEHPKKGAVEIIGKNGRSYKITEQPLYR
jgi:hypothetical protein